MKLLCESLPAAGSSEHPRNTEASLLVRRDGSYLLAYTEFSGKGHDDSAAEIIGLISRDRGETWGERRVLQPNTGGCNVMSAALLDLGNGSVLLGWIRKDSHQSCTLFVRRSEDEGETFGEAVQVNDWQAYMGFVNDSLIRLRSGRILCPAYFSAGPCWTDREHYVVRICMSDDEGRTWRHAATDVDCPQRGAMEPVLVERPDDTLLMLIRTQTGWVYQSESQDQGLTWSPAVPSVLPSQEAPIAARMIPGSDRMLLVWNAAYDPDAGSHGGRRSPLHLAVADPWLRTMPELQVLDASDSATFAYASLAFDHDRVLLTYYVGQDQALVGGGSQSFLSLKFRALTLP